MKPAAFLLLFLAIASVLCAQDVRPLKTLFIGNSYTNYHNLPELVAQMAHSKGKRLYYEMIVPGGRTFERHWEEGNAQRAIAEKDWDVVMFQNQSFEPLSDPDNMRRFAQQFADEVRKTNARMFFYLTMAYSSEALFNERGAGLELQYEDMQKHLNRAYIGLAKELKAEVSPVGLAWGIVRNEHPELSLHANDGSHPNHRGAYLSALVMYAALFDDEPTGMPTTLYPHFHNWRTPGWGSELSVTEAERAIFEKAATRAIEISKRAMK